MHLKWAGRLEVFARPFVRSLSAYAKWSPRLINPVVDVHRSKATTGPVVLWKPVRGGVWKAIGVRRQIVEPVDRRVGGKLLPRSTAPKTKPLFRFRRARLARRSS